MLAQRAAVAARPTTTSTGMTGRWRPSDPTSRPTRRAARRAPPTRPACASRSGRPSRRHAACSTRQRCPPRWSPSAACRHRPSWAPRRVSAKGGLCLCCHVEQLSSVGRCRDALLRQTRRAALRCRHFAHRRVAAAEPASQQPPAREPPASSRCALCLRVLCVLSIVYEAHGSPASLPALPPCPAHLPCPQAPALPTSWRASTGQTGPAPSRD